MQIDIVTGDLLDQPTEAIVNPWNRNILPWWLLIPHGVSGAIKRRAGLQPFRELGRAGVLPLGAAVATSAGRLPHQAIIHVAAIDRWWRSSDAIIAEATRNAISCASSAGLGSLAFPILGAGAGRFDPARAEQVMAETLAAIKTEIIILIVRYHA